MSDRDRQERLRSAQWPTPSPDLRARIAAIRVHPNSISWTDRVWYSRASRIWIAAAAVALVALDVWGARMNGASAPTALAAEAEAQRIADLVESVGIPSDAAASMARRAIARPQPAARNLATLFMGEDR